MSDNTQPNLDDLRREIDQIDREIHGLLQRRAETVLRLGAVKEANGDGGGGAMRPGREAQIIRALIARHHGPLPLTSLVGLWRSMIATYLRLQYPFTVQVFSGTDAVVFWDLARVHFGAGTPLETAADARAIVAAVAAAETVVGVLPPPAMNDWWAALPLHGERPPRILAELPILAQDGGPTAYVIARSAPEPSGDDITWIASHGATSEPNAIMAAARAVGLELSLVAAYNPGGARVSHLFASDRPLDAAELAAVANAAGGDAGVIGMFARPLAL